MGQIINEQSRTNDTRVKTRSGGAVLLALALTAAILGGAYAGLCAWAGSRNVFYPGESIHGLSVEGLGVDEAAGLVSASLPERSVALYSAQNGAKEGWKDEPERVSVSLGELGYTAERCDAMVRRHFEEQQATPFLSRGARFLSVLTGDGKYSLTAEDRDEEVFQAGVERLAEELAVEPQDGSYEVLDDQILLTKEANGRRIRDNALAAALEAGLAAGEDEIQIEFESQAAQPLSIPEVHEAVSGEMANARYDTETGEIVPERRGASFDTASAQRMLNNAAPGETVSIPADIQEPEITAQHLKAVLFQDLLGECTTHVGGTAARINNVRLSSSAFDGTVLNSGDVFSYNETVGQRTEAKGYKAAPAYVQGETVDEIGGGVCQPSSTLYYACLLANMEITDRYAHRYIPSYITRGMDATVSWGGPDYKFTNNTKYPVKIVAKYENNYLTVQLWGTKTDDLTVKMTYETLSTTEFKEVEQLDPTLAPGQRQVKVTPYTGYKVRTYRNIFDGSGNLVSSEVEAISDYKSRDRLVLVGPPKTEEEPEASAGATAPVVPGIPVEQEPSIPSGAEEPNVPATAPAEVPAEPPAPEEPPAIVVLPSGEE